MTQEPTEVAGGVGVPTCYRHSEREAHIRCQRCTRPICPDCMVPASVGFQCPECVREGTRTTRQARTAYGGLRPSTGGAVTMSLIAINVVVLVLVLATGGADGSLLVRLALIPRGTLYLVNGHPELVRGVSQGATWQLVTSIFTHVQFWHIGFNMLALYVLGPQLEMMLGRARYLALYLLSGLTGSAVVYWLAAPTSVTLGASGAIFGLMGALLVVAVKLRSNVQSLLTLVGINVLLTAIGAGFISWQGHLGGFVGGVVLGCVLVYAPRQRRTFWQGLGMGLVTLGIVVAVMLRTMALS